MPNEIKSQNNEQNDMNEILLTIKEFADNVYQRFDDIDRKFVEVDQRFQSLEVEMNSRFDALEKRVTHIEMTMVTKYYLDDKLADFRLFNHKLLSVLEDKKVITKFNVQELRQLT